MTDPRRGRHPSASGLILAGGASSRFGPTKALALFHGRPLIHWVASALEPSCGEILLSIGARAEAAPFQCALPGAELVRDAHGDRGPIEGLGRGFLAAKAPVVLVAPCDAPLLRPSLYSALLGILRDHEAAVPRWEAMDPVRAVYRRDAVVRALARDADSVGSPSALVDRLDAVFLEGDALLRADPTRASFIDVNRGQDLTDALLAAPSRPWPGAAPSTGS